jgi:hypothetical protein
MGQIVECRLYEGLTLRPEWRERVVRNWILLEGEVIGFNIVGDELAFYHWACEEKLWRRIPQDQATKGEGAP